MRTLKTLCRFCLPKIVDIDQYLLKLFGKYSKGPDFSEPQCIGLSVDIALLRMTKHNITTVNLYSVFLSSTSNAAKCASRKTRRRSRGDT